MPSSQAFSFKKNQRFKKQDFADLFASQKKKSGRFFILFYQPSSLAYPSIGTVISKKHARTAVRRQLTKRLVIEYFRLHQQELGHMRLMFLAKAGIDRASRQELQEDIITLFTFAKKQVKLLQENDTL